LLFSAEVEKKIKAFHTIEDIVSVMKAYAGVTIRKTEELVLNIRSYEENILYAIADVMAHYPDLSLQLNTDFHRVFKRHFSYGVQIILRGL
jgi:F-type H+-transporting ATPase subunit gamma